MKHYDVWHWQRPGASLSAVCCGELGQPLVECRGSLMYLLTPQRLRVFQYKLEMKHGLSSTIGFIFHDGETILTPSTNKQSDLTYCAMRTAPYLSISDSGFLSCHRCSWTAPTCPRAPGSAATWLQVRQSFMCAWFPHIVLLGCWPHVQ